MTEKLVLTGKEEIAARRAAAAAIDAGWRDANVVAAVVDAINAVRFGDPVGTLRKRKDHAAQFALRTEEGWIVYPFGAESTGRLFKGARPDATWGWGTNRIADWPVVYTPNG